MKIISTRKKEFLDWVCQQDSEQEERQETPKRKNYPETDMEQNERKIRCK